MTLKKPRRRRLTNWTEEHDKALIKGPGMFPPREFSTREGGTDRGNILQAWLARREKIEAEWTTAGQRPWAWWVFDSIERRNISLPEPEQLEQLGELTTDELEQLRMKALIEDEKLHAAPHSCCSWPFRRDWSFWKFIGKRNPAMSEAEQLIVDGFLNSVEKAIQANPQKALAGRILLTRSRFCYLDDCELDLLKLWPPKLKVEK